MDTLSADRGEAFMRSVVLLWLLALAGCAASERPTADLERRIASDFGNAVNANIAAQAVNPMPVALGPSDTDGRRVSDAMDRYRSGKVYTPHLPLERDRVNSPPPPPDK
jgi:hypothetical protein